MLKKLVFAFSILSLISCDDDENKKVVFTSDKELQSKIDSLEKKDSLLSREKELSDKIEGYSDKEKITIDGYEYTPFYFKIKGMDYLIIQRNGEFNTIINLSLDSAKVNQYKNTKDTL